MSFRIHVSLPISDLEESISFYERLFDTKASKRRDDYANFRLDEPPIHLALNLAPEEASVGATRSHFGVELERNEQLETWTRRLTTAEQPVLEEENIGCCYAKADKTWVTDPDGHQWELWVRTGEFDKLSPETSDCCAPEPSQAPTVSGCC